MAWWILFGLIALGLCIFLLVDDEIGWVGFFLLVGLTQLLALALAALVAGLAGCVMEVSGVSTTCIKDTKPIYALADNNSVSGSFFLGCGTVEDEMRYYYIVEDDLGKHMKNIRADNAYLVDADEPTITVVTYDWENKAWNWLGDCSKAADYIFAIPAGSVTSCDKVDLN